MRASSDTEKKCVKAVCSRYQEEFVMILNLLNPVHCGGFLQQYCPEIINFFFSPKLLQ